MRHVMRQCLETLDLPRLRALWQEVSPHLPQPATDEECLTSAHVARTMAESMPFSLRAYSHAWLLERGYPSHLPDALRPRAQREYPVVVGAVGIAVKSNYPVVVREIRGAMEDVVENCYADKKTEPEYVKPRMLEARQRAKKRLFG